MYFIFSTSLHGYFYYSNESLKNVNIINDDVFYIGEGEHIKKFISDNYPLNFECTDDELASILDDIVHYIGQSNTLIDLKNQVVLKMLNKSVNIKEKWIRASNPEISYMTS
ncbi:CRISPR-associated protein Csn2-St [Butyrivibrio sp. NC3005]|uniref:CRISPR-associated protein Csn2-St n=1 Tax=Butyrivibrio sp. NC3005 TaxID=1280685 RepID=UPI0004054127|nr:CRISPR-associated protein Csn2-St [Butyrivibrio sp. NC3005]